LEKHCLSLQRGARPVVFFTQSFKLWPEKRHRILEKVMKNLGACPNKKMPLNPKIISEEDCNGFIRRKISITFQPGDLMPAYLLIPKNIKGDLCGCQPGIPDFRRQRPSFILLVSR